MAHELPLTAEQRWEEDQRQKQNRIVLQQRKALSTAEAMFNAYNEAPPNPWQTFDGRPVPKWDEVSEQVRSKWTAAALCAIKLFDRG